MVDRYELKIVGKDHYLKLSKLNCDDQQKHRYFHLILFTRLVFNKECLLFTVQALFFFSEMLLSFAMEHTSCTHAHTGKQIAKFA